MTNKPFPPIRELVPHSGRMVVLDELLSWSPGEAAASITLTDNSTFVEDGQADSMVCIEYMAQTVAACLGYEAFLGGEGTRVGMVIASRSFETSIQAIAAGTTLKTSVKRTRGNESLSHFDCAVTNDGVEIAAATLTLIHAESPPE